MTNKPTLVTDRQAEEIQARADAATVGPWEDVHNMGKVFNADLGMNICDIRGWGYLTGQGSLRLPEDKAIAIQEANGAFIAASRTDIPSLLETREQLVAGLRHVMICDAPWCTGCADAQGLVDAMGGKS